MLRDFSFLARRRWKPGKSVRMARRWLAALGGVDQVAHGADQGGQVA